MSRIIDEFKEFAVKGNVVDMAVGIIIGAAFGAIANSLVTDIVMPPLGVLVGNIDFTNFFLVVKEGTTPGPYETLKAAQEAGAVTVNYGLFTNKVVNFFVVAFAVFLLVRAINQIRRTEQMSEPASPSEKACRYCRSKIAINAIRCPFCTSDLGDGETKSA